MTNLIEIKKEDILVSSVILNYDKPDYIYIPIPYNSTFKKKRGDYVKIGEEVINDNYASVSGTLMGIKSMNSVLGIQDFIEVENDYQEKQISITKNKDNFNIFKINNKNFILNCLDDEPYVLSENFYLHEYYEGYLELLDKLSKIYNLEHIIICVKSNSSSNINKLTSTLGMYPNIELKICPNLYLLGQDKFLSEYLELNDCYIIKASDFDKYYNYIMRNRIVSSKIITISGNALKNPSIINVKIGSKLKDIIEELIIINDTDAVFIANGLMQGKIIDIDNFIITEDVNSILIMKKIEDKKESKCLNCGACINICPVGINPLKLEDKELRDKCLKCNLCSYICPSYINFNKYLTGKKE